MNTFLICVSMLITAHLLFDFYLQPNTWVKDKQRKGFRSAKLVLHALLHGAVSGLIIQSLFSCLWSTLCAFAIIAFSHWLIDLYKICKRSGLAYFIQDQILHISVLVAIALHASGLGLTYPLTALAQLDYPQLMLIAAFVLILKPTSIFIALVLNRFSPIDKQINQGLEDGGELIGYLERILILLFILMGQYAVVGFVLAAKSIFRFGDLNKAKEQNLTEYVLLGTLLSVTLTSAVGLLLRPLLF